MNKITHVLALGAFGIITAEFGIIGILPKIAAHFQVSADKAGALISLFALVVAVSGPFMTLMMSRFNKKRIIQCAISLFILSSVLAVFSDSFEWLLFARILPAFLLPVYFSNGLAIAVTSVPEKNAIKAVATVYGGLSVATVIGIPLTTYIADLYSWKASFWITAGINSIALAGVSYVIPAMRETRKLSYGAQLAILKKKTLWLSILTTCFIAAGAFSTYSYFADYLRSVFEMDGSQTSVMLLLFGVTGIFGNWAAGVALSKNIYRTIQIYLVSMGIIFLLLQYTGSGFLLQSVLIGTWGFFHMAGFVVSQSWINHFAPEAPEFASSLVVSTGNLGIALGTASGGLIITHLGIHRVPWGGLVLFCFSFLLVMLSIYQLKKKGSYRSADTLRPGRKADADTVSSSRQSSFGAPFTWCSGTQ